MLYEFMMRIDQINNEIRDLLDSGRELTLSDFLAASPDTPIATVNSRIRSLVQKGILSRTGRGRYVAVKKLEYKVPVTPWMLEVNDYLVNNCEGINHCISLKGQNLFVEVARGDIPFVYSCLKTGYGKVVLEKAFKSFQAPLEGYIVVGPLISEAPIIQLSGCPAPSLEKTLVDSFSRKEDKDDSDLPCFQKAMEVYSLNVDRMRRYAARRGVSNELEDELAAIDYARVELFSNIQRYFSKTGQVCRVWVFGSFARGEETPESDVDLLVDYDSDIKVSMLDIIRQKLDLEKILGREVDLVENGFLKDFALQSAERDKYLIYER